MMADWLSVGIGEETEKWMVGILCQAKDKGHASPSFKFVFKNHRLIDIVLNNEERRRMVAEGRTHAVSDDGVETR